MLLDQIKQDQLDARKAKNKVVASILTTLIGELETQSKGKGIDLHDATVLSVVKKFKVNIAFTLAKAPSDDLRIELETLSRYEPQQLSEIELKYIIDEFVNDGFNSIAKIMSKLKECYSGKYDGALAAKLINHALHDVK